MYKIFGSDLKEYGPISADMVRQWIAERRANGQTRIRLDGSEEWKRLGDLPVFCAALAAAPASVTPGSAATTGTGQNSGLAITSLVLGILAMAGFIFLAGIPAIITGHMARGRARKEPSVYGGAGFALAGLILGYVGTVFGVLTIAILAGLLLPALDQAKGRTQSIHCVNNLKQIGLAARIYANDHDETFPRDFLTMKEELGTPKILTCNSDATKAKAMDWGSFSSANVSYEIVSPGMKEDASAAGKVFARCPIHEHVCMGDGSVQQGSRNRRR